MVLRFRYKYLERPEVGGSRLPLIPVTLIGPDAQLDILALLDSGADFSAIPLSIAEILGLDVSGKKEEVVGLGGAVSAVEAVCTMLVSKGHERYYIRSRVKVILEGGDDLGVLIGREDFWDEFHITFKEKDEIILLKKV